MDIVISNYSDKPIYEQIQMQIQNMIIGGILKEGDPLPSIRVLAKELRISVITTKRAYEELEKDGFVVSVGGKGCFVAKKNEKAIKEEQWNRIVEYITDVVEIAKLNKIKLEELKKLIEQKYKEENEDGECH